MIITEAEDEKATDLRPCIAELLRTRHCPKDLILRVDKIVDELQPLGSRSTILETDEANNRSKWTYRILLTDGELVIQAVINRDFHCLLQNNATVEGQLIELRHYSVQRARRINGTGEVVYLAIEEYRNHGEGVIANNQDGNVRLQSSRVVKRPPDNLADDEESIRPKRQKSQAHLNADPPINDSNLDEFETFSLLDSSISRRRKALEQISANGRLWWSMEDGKLMQKKTAGEQLDQDMADRESPTGGCQDVDTASGYSSSTETQCEMKLHTLASLLDAGKALPRKNYICKVFAIITWVSMVVSKQPGLPEKRHIKIHDLTVPRQYSGISVSIFVNARQFRPKVGTVALFTGLTAQKWDGEVILNAYERLCAGKEWFIDDEAVLRAEGFPIDEVKSWWQKRIQR